MNWLTLSILAGLISAVGTIISKHFIGSAIPGPVLVGIMGATWFISSATYQSVRLETVSFSWSILILAILAGLFYWIENSIRFSVLPKAPVIAYVFLTISLTSTLVTITYDIFTLYRSGNLKVISVYHLGGIILAIGAISLFALAPKK